MSRKPTLLIAALVVLVSCQPETAQIDWVFVEGGTFEQGKNQFIVERSANAETCLIRPTADGIGQRFAQVFGSGYQGRNGQS